MSKYLGDYAKPTGAGTLEFKFSTFRPSTGAAWSLSAGAAVTVYKGGSGNTTGQSTTLTRDWNSITGLNHVSVDLSQAFFVDGEVYEAVITAGTIDSVSVIGACVGRFTLRAQASLYPTLLGRTLDVSASGEAGIDFANIGSPTTTVNLSGTTIKAVTDMVTANAIQISGDATAADNLEAAADGTGYNLGAGQIVAASVSGAVNSVTTGVTVATNNDKTGYSLATAPPTAAAIADAVWDEPFAGHTGSTTYGGRVVRAANSNVEVQITGSNHVAADIHELQPGVIDDGDFAAGSVNDRLDTMLVADGAVYQYTANALELAPSGGGGGGSTTVRMGPFTIKAEGQASDLPLDINKGATHGIDCILVDAQGTGVDLTGATLSTKVYDTSGTLVATISGTATYAAGGAMTWTIPTSVTNTAGTYTATITRTTGASDTEVFGPLRIYVRDI